jgi:squalene-associated FAD-dependent desaturase
MKHTLTSENINKSKGTVLILGAGLAGLSAASYLSSGGYKTIILESSGKPGGRAYSFTDKDTGSVIDNGQHIMMGCYKYTLDFFNKIGAEKNFKIQDNLAVNFLKRGKKIHTLKSVSSLYPLNLFIGLIRYTALKFTDRFRLLKIFFKLYLYSSRDLEKMSVDEWLTNENQSAGIKKAFWEILAVGALNTSIKKASAKMFADILKQMFFRGNKSASIVLPVSGLSESYCGNAISFINKNGGEISFYETVTSLEFSRNKLSAVCTSKRKITDFDYVISALPLYALKRILSSEKQFAFPELEYSSILSMHLWLNNNTLKEKFYGLIDSPVHWVFNHNKYITIVISDADKLVFKSREELYCLISNELDKYLGIKQEDISSYKVIKEKRATFIPSNAILKHRPGPETAYRNFLLAGDWTNTGLPATIEGAVKSGVFAGNHILKNT